MFMPAVRMNRMIQVTKSNKILSRRQLLNYIHDIQELTSRMMNMFANVPEAGALH